MEYMATLKDKAFDLAIVDPPYDQERLFNPETAVDQEALF
jgi:16S rRNA G966 N2-methylase RsmD